MNTVNHFFPSQNNQGNLMVKRQSFQQITKLHPHYSLNINKADEGKKRYPIHIGKISDSSINAQIIKSDQQQIFQSTLKKDIHHKTLSTFYEDQTKQKFVKNSLISIMKPYLKHQLHDFLISTDRSSRIFQQENPKILKSNNVEKNRPLLSLQLVPSLNGIKLPVLEHTSPLLQLRHLEGSGEIQQAEKNQETKDTWSELKVQGSLYKARVNHTAVNYKDQVIVYGGRDNEKGCFGDLCVLYVDMDGFFRWKVVEQKGNGPEYLSHHSAVVMGDKMLVYGGRISAMKSSNVLYSLNLDTYYWSVVELRGTKPIPVDGHTAVMLEGKMVVFGGICPDPICESVNLIQIYDEDEWEIPHYDGCPLGRSSHSATVLNKAMWVYGGADGQIRFNDLYRWDYDGWTQIQFMHGPGPRMGHIMFSEQNMLYFFGGSMNILCERNDLWSFDGSTWCCIEEGFNIRGINDHNLTRLVREKARGLNRQGSILKRRGSIIYVSDSPDSPQTKQMHPRNKAVEDYVTKFNELKQANATNSTSFHMEIREQHEKPIDLYERNRQQQKKQLLSYFQLNKKEEQRFLIMTPTTSQMKQSIKQIEEHNPSNQPNKVRDKNVIQATNRMMKLKNVRPMPRDGSTITRIPDGWVLLGGDRHKVTFNDTWLLAQEQLDKFMN